jgi:hypothetical protein
MVVLMKGVRCHGDIRDGKRGRRVVVGRGEEERIAGRVVIWSGWWWDG